MDTSDCGVQDVPMPDVEDMGMEDSPVSDGADSPMSDACSVASWVSDIAMEDAQDTDTVSGAKKEGLTVVS